MKSSLYLAGPMTGVTWRESLEWRQKVERALGSSWTLINPVKAQTPETLDDIISIQYQDDERRPLEHTATGVTAQDEFYIRKADWVLANFAGADKVSIGTCWELGFAWALGKQILSVVEPKSAHDHPFIRRRSHLFTDNLDEAIDFFLQIAI